jgi:septal ring factor EnvC (AmiA/AmiB activator)
MRIVAVVLGALLLIGGGVVVVVADEQRQAAVEQAHEEAERAEQRLAEAEAENLDLAERLTALRSAIAELDDSLADTEGFLE